MCVICIKPKGVEMPLDHYIENMWYHNHDGAGFMYATGNKVVIDKGYMKFDEFKKALKKLGDKINLKDTALVMHFRIGTAGGNVPANTHPFPISDSIPMLQKLDCTTKLGVAHNGIIPVTPRQKNISDTMEYIASTLAPLQRYDKKFYRSKDLLQMIQNQTGSKLAFLTPEGEVYTVGNFIEDDGCLYSNSSYSYMTYYRSGATHCYGYLPYQDEADDARFPSAWATSRYMYADKLMLLENGDYVVDFDSGNYYDSDDVTLFMDESGALYVYDDYTQTAYMVMNNAGAFNKEGIALKFDPEKAADMIIDNKEIVDLEEYADPFANLPPLTDEEKEKAAADLSTKEERSETLRKALDEWPKDNDDDDDSIIHPLPF